MGINISPFPTFLATSKSLWLKKEVTLHTYIILKYRVAHNGLYP